MLRLFCRRFVDIQQSYSWNFRIKDGNDFSPFGRTEVIETQGMPSVDKNYFTILLFTPMQINSHGDYHSIVCHHLSPTNCTSTRLHVYTCGFQDNISGFNSWNRNVRMWLLVASGEIPKYENK